MNLILYNRANIWAKPKSGSSPPVSVVAAASRWKRRRQREAFKVSV